MNVAERNLLEIYDTHKYVGEDDYHGDKGTTHSYIEEYSRLLEPYRNGCTFLEIGLAFGESLKMWNEYFNNSTVVGVDISADEIGPLLDDPQYNIIICDATTLQFLEKISEYNFDVIIDDGSHIWEDVKTSFEILRPKIRKNGIYIIEDVVPYMNFSSKRDVANQFGLDDSQIEIVDNTRIKNRGDDCLITFKF